MLTEIKLTNFKCFKEETSIPLSRFNLFTGVNGAGKSTALQALLLMRQSIEHNPYTTELILNGSCVNLGDFNDVRNSGISPSKHISIELTILNYINRESTQGSIGYKLSPKEDNMSLIIKELIIKQTPTLSTNKKYFDNENKIEFHGYYENGDELYKISDDNPQSHNRIRLIKLTPHLLDNRKKSNETTSLLKDEPKNIGLSYRGLEGSNELIFLNFDDEKNQDNLFFEKIHFISADRIGPQEFYQKSMLTQFRNVGTKGEFAVNLLDKVGDELVVNENLYLKENPRVLGENPMTLKAQTEAWLGKILNPLSLEAAPLGKSNFLELLIGGFKPSNVGFGYSSILPIIVTGLIAKPNEKIIIENPEIHLHPKAQSALIEFLVKVANTGVQIFIESHSDHVLNALRIATKNKLLKPDDVNILFFAQENGNSKIIKPTIDENGRISEWPESFFDETAKSLASLAAGQRPRFKAPEA